MRVQFHILLLLLFTSLAKSKKIQSAYNLYDALFSNYSREIRPVDDDNDIINVTTTFFLSAILDLNEPSGQLVSSMSVNLMWNDILLRWNPAHYEGRTKIEISKKHIWTPDLILMSPSQMTKRLGEDNDKVLIYSYGNYDFLSFTVTDIFYTICDIDVTYFPFDTQVCEIRFSLFDYADRIRYRFTEDEVNMNYFYENGIWDVVKTSIYTEMRNPFAYDIICNIHLKRRSMYCALNLLGPILILMLLNCMVFLLPAESGERVGFTMTILLAIAVYMTIISEQLPQTSRPVSLLTFILATYTAQSSIICLCTICSLRLFFRDESKTMSKKWFMFVKLMNFRRNRISDKNDENFVSTEDTKIDPEIRSQDQKVSWKTVAEMFDIFALGINVAACVLIAIIYLGIVLPNA